MTDCHKKKHYCTDEIISCSCVKRTLLLTLDCDIDGKTYRRYIKVNYCPICGKKSDD